jgi:hypothetical protein
VAAAQSDRAGHGSVWAGFNPFGNPTRASRVLKFPTRDSVKNMKKKKKSDGYRAVRIGFFGRVVLIAQEILWASLNITNVFTQNMVLRSRGI